MVREVKPGTATWKLTPPKQRRADGVLRTVSSSYAIILIILIIFLAAVIVISRAPPLAGAFLGLTAHSTAYSAALVLHPIQY